MNGASRTSGRWARRGARRGARLAAGIMLALAVVLLVGRDGTDPPSSEWSVPDPDTSSMQPRVARRILEARVDVMVDPASAEAWGRFGAVCDAHRLYDEAAACYERAAGLDPGDFRWPYLSAIVSGARGDDPSRVAALFEETLHLRPDYAPAHLRLAAIAHDGGRPEDARRACERALEIDPALACAHRDLGQVMLALGDPGRAVGHLERAAALDAGDRAVWAALAQAHARGGNRAAAAGAADRARRAARVIAPPDPVRSAVESLGESTQHRIERAAALRDAGDYEGVIENLKIVQEARPDNGVLHYNLGVAYARTGRARLALDHLAKAVSLRDDLYLAHCERASLLMGRGEFPAAIGHLRRARAAAPDNADVLMWLGAALAGNGNVDEAVATFEEAARMAPLDARTHANLGAALVQRGRPQEAILPLQEALRIDPRFTFAHYNLGLALEALGRPSEAAGHYRRATDLEPGHPAAERLIRLPPPDRP